MWIRLTALFILFTFLAACMSPAPNQTAPEPGLELVLGDSFLRLSPGQETVLDVQISSSNLSAAITTSVSGLPEGVTISSDELTLANLSASLSFKADPTAQTGEYTLTVTANAGSLSSSQTLILIIEEVATTGSLILFINGLPDGLEADITMTASDFTRTLTTSQQINNLKPDSYTVQAAPVTQSDTTYIPSFQTRTVEIQAGETSELTLSYTEQEKGKATLNIFIEGLREGVNAEASLRNGQTTQAITETISLQLKPDLYELTTSSVTPDSATFEPETASQTIVLEENEIKDITLSYNCVQVLPPDTNLNALLQSRLNKTTFSCTDLETLSQLNAEGEDIAQLEGLQYAINLENLNLQDNDLTVIPANFFSAYTSLTKLDLVFNEISNLSPESFAGLTELKDLSISDNPLGNLPAGIFDDLNKLEELSMVNIDITELRTEDFNQFPELDTLFIDENTIPELPANFFDNLDELSTLGLSSMNLTSLPAGIQELELSLLSLSDNQLRSFPETFFDNMTDLYYLDLNDNFLSDISPIHHTFGYEDFGNNLDLSLEDNCLQLNKIPTKGQLIDLEEQDVDVDTSGNPRAAGCENLPQAISNTFESYTEGWTTTGNTSNVRRRSSGGITDSAYVYAESLNPNSPIDWYWLAPDEYYGDATEFIGGTLSFSLKQLEPIRINAAQAGAVILEGAGISLSHSLPEIPSPEWSSYQLTLSESGDWVLKGTVIDRALFTTVMADLTSIRIRGNYLASSEGALDQVVFIAP